MGIAGGGASQAPVTRAAISPGEIAQIVQDVENVIEDVMSGKQSLGADIVTFVLAGLGVAAELSWINSQVDALAAAAATAVIPAIFRIIASARAGQKAKLKAAAIGHAVALRVAAMRP